MNVLEKKVKDVVKGQGSRDVLIETLQAKIQELQDKAAEDKVSALVKLQLKLNCGTSTVG